MHSFTLNVWRSDVDGHAVWRGEIVGADGVYLRRFEELDELACLLIQLLDGGSLDGACKARSLAGLHVTEDTIRERVGRIRC